MKWKSPTSFRFQGTILSAALLAAFLSDCSLMRCPVACMNGGGMISDRLENADQYANLHPAFKKAFAFLRRDSLKNLPAGRHDIDGDRIYCMISGGPAKKRTEARLEAHRKYIDIQYVIEGADEMGWKPTASCGIPDGDYDGTKDVVFFKDKPRKWIKVPEGSFAIFYPRDAHAPMTGQGEIHKAVIKVAVE
jgi:biofilm protein TabA